MLLNLVIILIKFGTKLIWSEIAYFVPWAPKEHHSSFNFGKWYHHYAQMKVIGAYNDMYYRFYCCSMSTYADNMLIILCRF